MSDRLLLFPGQEPPEGLAAALDDEGEENGDEPQDDERPEHE